MAALGTDYGFGFGLAAAAPVASVNSAAPVNVTVLNCSPTVNSAVVVGKDLAAVTASEVGAPAELSAAAGSLAARALTGATAFAFGVSEQNASRALACWEKTVGKSSTERAAADCGPANAEPADPPIQITGSRRHTQAADCESVVQ